MTVRIHPNKLVTCLTTDTKPTSAVDPFTLLLETDTGKIYTTVDSGTTWTHISLAVANIVGTLGVAAGGTGAATLTGVLKGNGTSAITAAALLAVADGGTGAGTLTGILKGNGTSAVTTLTAPSGTILGDTDTIAITNKTIVADSNTISATTNVAGQVLRNNGTKFVAANNPVFPSSGRAWGYWSGFSSATSAFHGLLLGPAQYGTSGTYTATIAAGGVGVTIGTQSTVNTVTGYRHAPWTEGDLNPRWKVRFKLGGTTNIRVHMGFTSISTTPTTNVEPLPSAHGVMLVFDSGVSATNFQYYENSGNANSTVNAGPAADTNSHTLEIRGSSAAWTISVDGAAPTTLNTTIPTATTDLITSFNVENLTSGSQTLTMYYEECDQDI